MSLVATVTLEAEFCVQPVTSFFLTIMIHISATSIHASSIRVIFLWCRRPSCWCSKTHACNRCRVRRIPATNFVVPNTCLRTVPSQLRNQIRWMGPPRESPYVTSLVKIPLTRLFTQTNRGHGPLLQFRSLSMISNNIHSKVPIKGH